MFMQSHSAIWKSVLKLSAISRQRNLITVNICRNSLASAQSINYSTEDSGNNHDVSTDTNSAMPTTPCPFAPLPLRPTPPVTMETLQLLEKLSLVDISNKEGLRRLNFTISMADRLQHVNVEGVKPLVTLLEHVPLRLADDTPEERRHSAELLSCASQTVEDFFTVPPGNISYSPGDEYYKRVMEPIEEDR